ncbi:MAG: zinc ABC transporter substrate-binding protein [Myxococcales bacterium]|nr:zinc ABC transporter substrate-binding protein [Myxococcales bacterium]MCB9580856.1 zinc ABC transporter substrate-binding protein [Polyangiaceae bacterium]
MTMKRFFAVLVALATLALGATAEAKLSIVATTPNLASVAKEVAGDDADVTALALHTQDPHFVDAKPKLALTLAKADLLISAGLSLEIGWLPTLQTGARNGDIQRGGKGYLDCSQFVKVLDVPEGKVDRSMGDVHPQGNPHYMYDPRQAARVAKGIAEKLAKLDPAHAGDYKKNAISFIKRLGKATKGWQKKLAKAKGAKIIAYHKSYPYLANWLGLDVVEHVEPRPGIPPNPHHVTHVLDVAKQDHVKAILQEAFYPAKTSEMIAKQAGLTVLRLPAAPNFKGGEGYIEHMSRVVNALAKVYQ